MKNGILFEFLFFTFCLGVSFASGSDPYRSSWIDPPAFGSDHIFHKSAAKRIANAKMASGPIEGRSNVAAFGLTLSVENTIGEKRFYCVEFPNVLYSSYSVTEAEPVVEVGSKNQVIAVSDLFRGTPLTSQTQKHQLCSFILWLLSKPHFYMQGELVADLLASLETIQFGDVRQLTSIRNGTEFRVLQKFLHCEQLFLYKMLVEDYIVDSMIHQLFQKKEAIFNDATKDIQFFLEESTYNDMCQNCFLSMRNMIGDIQEKIGNKLLQIMSSDRSLTQYMTKCLPVKLSIRISSFRPFDNSRVGAVSLNYLTYYKATTTVPYSACGVVQFFNPWVPQYLLLNRFQKLQKDLEDLSSCIVISDDEATVLDKAVTDLSFVLGPHGFSKTDVRIPTTVKKRGDFLEDTRQVGMFALKLTTELNECLKTITVDKTVLVDITKTLFSYKGTINLPDVYRSILPLVVTLASVSHVIPNEDFIRNLFWANNIYDLKFAETEFAKLKLPKDFMALMDIIQQDVGFIQKFVLPMVQILETHGDLREFILLFTETIKYSTNIHSVALNLLCQNILLPKVFPVISSIPDPKFQKDVLPIVMMLAQSQHVETSILERIMQHLRNMFVIYSVSEDAESDIIQQYTTQLETLKAIPSVVETIFEQKTLLHTIDLHELSKYGRNKRYDTKQIKDLCKFIKIDIPSIQPQIVTFIKKQLAVVKSNLEKITWFKSDDLRDSKLILKQMLKE